MDLNFLLRNAKEITLDRKTCSLIFRFAPDTHWSEFMECFRAQAGILNYSYTVNTFFELTVQISIHCWLLAMAHDIGTTLSFQKTTNSYYYVPLQKEKEKQVDPPAYPGV